MLAILNLRRDGARELHPGEVEAVLTGQDGYVWVDVQDGTDEELAWLQRTFGLHALELEDVRTRTEVPKLDEYGEHVFLAAHAARLVDGRGDGAMPAVELPEYDLIWGRAFVITAHAGSMAAVERARRRALEGRLPWFGPDAVVHAVLDLAVEEIVPVVERLEELGEDVEEALLAGAGGEAVQARLLGLRRALRRLDHVLGPLRFVVQRVGGPEAPFVSAHARPYFRDVFDLVDRLDRTVEAQQAAVASAYELHLSQLSHALAVAAQRTNEVVQRLTVVTSVFLPLTLIAGVYGMNFRYMPELQWRLGYPFALGLMALTAMGMVLYFRRRGWI